MRLNLYGSQSLRWGEYPQVEDLGVALSVGRQLEAVCRRYGFRGVTAPQMGIMFNMGVAKLDSGEFLSLVNPEITRLYGTEIEHYEDCISLPPYGNGCYVLRTVMVDVEYTEFVGQFPVRRSRTFSGRDASTVNHEIDHLTGTFFFDRASLYEKPKVLEKFEAWKRAWRQNGHHSIYEEVKCGRYRNNRRSKAVR